MTIAVQNASHPQSWFQKDEITILHPFEGYDLSLFSFLFDTSIEEDLFPCYRQTEKQVILLNTRETFRETNFNDIAVIASARSIFRNRDLDNMFRRICARFPFERGYDFGSWSFDSICSVNRFAIPFSESPLQHCISKLLV
jgi:hypothetical protein